MESFSGNLNALIDSLKKMHIDAIEMVTPKHAYDDIILIQQLSEQFGLLPSVGSDTHFEYRGNLNKFNIDLNDEMFSWIDEL